MLLIWSTGSLEPSPGWAHLSERGHRYGLPRHDPIPLPCWALQPERSPGPLLADQPLAPWFPARPAASHLVLWFWWFWDFVRFVRNPKNVCGAEFLLFHRSAAPFPHGRRTTI